MKRFAAFILLLFLLPALVCCEKSKSPVGDYDTLEGLASAVKHPLYLPSQSGWIPVSFTLNDKMEAIVAYRMGKKGFRFRMKEGEGHPESEAEVFGGSLKIGQLTVSYCGSESAVTDAWWTAGEYGYGVTFSDPVNEEELTALIASVR